MKTVNQISTQQLIENLAKELGKVKEVKAPEWAAFAKTGMHRERPPLRKDWWLVRAASMLRWVEIRGPIGVSKLRTKYGGRKNRGVKPDAFRRASGNVIRKIFQQLEAAGLVKKKENDIHKGRIITPKGVSLISKAGAQKSK